MRIPTDITLSQYIRQLIKANKIELFYCSEDWQELRQEVLDYFHNECQECLKKGVYTRANCVHHINKVRVRPDLALSKHYVDNKGIRQYNLIPLCDKCHNQAHPEKFRDWRGKDKFVNKERW